MSRASLPLPFVLFCFLIIRTSETAVGGGEVRERTQGQKIKSSYSYLKGGDDLGSFIVFLFVFLFHFPPLPLATTVTFNDNNSYWLSCHPHQEWCQRNGSSLIISSFSQKLPSLRKCLQFLFLPFIGSHVACCHPSACDQVSCSLIGCSLSSMLPEAGQARAGQGCLLTVIPATQILSLRIAYLSPQSKDCLFEEL